MVVPPPPRSVSLTVRSGSAGVNWPPVATSALRRRRSSRGGHDAHGGGSDPDGTIAKVDFYDGATLIGTAIVAPYTYSLTLNALGALVVTARAYDNKGAQTTSTPVVVTASNNSAPRFR